MDADLERHSVQIVCKGYQQTTNVTTSKERVNLQSNKTFPRGYKKI